MKISFCDRAAQISLRGHPDAACARVHHRVRAPNAQAALCGPTLEGGREPTRLREASFKKLIFEISPKGSARSRRAVDGVRTSAFLTGLLDAADAASGLAFGDRSKNVIVD